MKPFAFAMIVVSSVLSGCASNNVAKNSQPFMVDDVVISEPLQANYEEEKAIFQLSLNIALAGSDEDKLSQLFYERGIFYDSLGMRWLAATDFQRAIKYRPAFSDAYNFLGIHFTLIGKYEEAFKSFDDALDIDDEQSYVYLNRGIASYYYAKYALATEQSREHYYGLSLKDMEAFYLKNTSDPYRAIWLYLVENEVDPENARFRLIYNATLLDQSKWAYQIIDMLLNKIDEQTFITNMTKGLQSREEMLHRLCEGYFYLAQLKLQQGEEETAKNYFRLAMTTNVYKFVEHKYARLELAHLYEKAKQRHNPLSQYTPTKSADEQ